MTHSYVCQNSLACVKSKLNPFRVNGREKGKKNLVSYELQFDLGFVTTNCVCVCVCVKCVCVCVCVCMCERVCVCVCVFLSVFRCVREREHVCVRACVCLCLSFETVYTVACDHRVHVCVCVCVCYVCVRVYVCVCVCVCVCE